MIKDTCTFELCYFGKLFDKPEMCPNYMENWYYPKDTDPIKVKDCAPRRTVEMLKDIHTRLLATQKANEQQRNEASGLTEAFLQVAETMQKQPTAIRRLPNDL